MGKSNAVRRTSLWEFSRKYRDVRRKNLNELKGFNGRYSLQRDVVELLDEDYNEVIGAWSNFSKSGNYSEFLDSLTESQRDLFFKWGPLREEGNLRFSNYPEFIQAMANAYSDGVHFEDHPKIVVGCNIDEPKSTRNGYLHPFEVYFNEEIEGRFFRTSYLDNVLVGFKEFFDSEAYPKRMLSFFGAKVKEKFPNATYNVKEGSLYLREIDFSENTVQFVSA